MNESQTQPASLPPGVINNYLVENALLAVFFMALPSLVGVVFASRVNPRLAAGDYRRAVAASKIAMLCCWLSLPFVLATIVAVCWLWVRWGLMTSPTF